MPTSVNFLHRLPILTLASIPLWYCPSIAQTTAPVSAQTDSSYQLKVQTNLVLVRVVVRDAKGEPIRGLTKEDFRLFDQGKEQSIAKFDEEPGAESPAAPAAEPPPGQPATAPTAPLAPRFIALYFDELNSSDADLIQARDAAVQYLATSLQPNDRVAIFTAEKILSNFTADANQIRQALSQLRASTRGPAHEHLCPDISDYQAYQILQTNDLNDNAWRVALAEAAACPVKITADPALDPRAAMQSIRMLAERIMDQAQNLTRGNLAQFEQVVKFISQAPGQRTIVLVSPGFLSESEQYALDRIIDRALRVQVVINSLDPKGLAVLMRESNAASSTIVLADPKASEARRHLDASKEFVGADVLAEMASGTGGVFFHNDNDLKAGFAALAGDPPHYVLAFAPKNGKWDGKFHALKVSLVTKEKGRTVQARRGYFAVQGDNVAETTTVVKNTPPSPAVTTGNDAGTTNPAAAEPAAAPPSASSAAASQPSAIEASTPESPKDDKEEASVAASTPEPAVPVHANLKPLKIHRGTNRVSLDQLDQFVGDSHGKSDAELAKVLANFELTESVDVATLLRLEGTLPGDKSRQALALQADIAAFLKPSAPTSTLPAAPSAEEQTQWLKSASDYVANALHKLPNFFATRDVTRFVDNPAAQANGVYSSYQPLHATDHSKGTVLYRDGKQVVDASGASAGTQTSSPGLVVAGEFGPILGTVLSDASKASISWSRWEAGSAGPLAVFRFSVPRNKSHYQAAYCCVNGIGLYKQISAYHGEVVIDPGTGSIMRIVIQADLKESYPLVRADLVVEYRPVEIGGKSYICPVRSVAIMKAYASALDLTAILPGRTAQDMSGSANMYGLPVQTMINDIAFQDYHLFRSDSRIVAVSE